MESSWKLEKEIQQYKQASIEGLIGRFSKGIGNGFRMVTFQEYKWIEVTGDSLFSRY